MWPAIFASRRESFPCDPPAVPTPARSPAAGYFRVEIGRGTVEVGRIARVVVVSRRGDSEDRHRQASPGQRQGAQSIGPRITAGGWVRQVEHGELAATERQRDIDMDTTEAQVVLSPAQLQELMEAQLQGKRPGLREQGC